MWRKLTSREQKLLLILGMVLSLSIFLRFFLGGQLPRFIELKQQVESQKQSLQNAIRLLQGLPQLLEKERQAQQELDLLTTRYKGFENGLPLLEIGKRAQKVELSGVYPGEVERKNGYFVLPLQIKVKGQYLEVMDFLRQLENLPFLAEIALPSIEALKQEGMVSAQFVLNLYSTEMAPGANLTEQWQLGKLNVFRYLKQDSPEQEAEQESSTAEHDSKAAELKRKTEDARLSPEAISRETQEEQAKGEKPEPIIFEEKQDADSPAIRYDFPVR